MAPNAQSFPVLYSPFLISTLVSCPPRARLPAREWVWGRDYSLEPRLPVPDFVSQLWSKLRDKIRNGEPGFEANETTQTPPTREGSAVPLASPPITLTIALTICSTTPEILGYFTCSGWPRLGTRLLTSHLVAVKVKSGSCWP